jgi:hypothetical protein
MTPRVEILSFPGCPNRDAVRRLVEQIADDLHLEVEIDDVEVLDGESADELRFLGSPTVRVNGHDVEPGADLRDDFALACRVYRGAHGLSGQPDAIWIRDALGTTAT